MNKMSETKTEKKMKQSVVPTANGAISVQGFSDQIQTFKTAYLFNKQLQTQIDVGKLEFRKLAKQATAGAAGRVRRVEFLADDGSCIPVSLPDYSKAGNRLAIKPETLPAEAAENLEKEGILERRRTITLSGYWVQWFDTVLAQAAASGQEPAEGIEQKVELRLTEEGISRLESTLAQEQDETQRETLEALLKRGLKASTVSVR